MSNSTGLVAWTLKHILPVRVKRMIALSSLAAHLKGIKDPDDELLLQLNRILHLAKYPKAMLLPVEYNDRIWQDFDTACIRAAGAACGTLKGFRMVGLTKSQARMVADRIISYLPEWLRYASVGVTRRDIYNLFISLELLTGSNRQTLNFK